VIVELFSDAGRKEGRGAWGAVVVRPGAEPLEASGAFRDRLHCSTLAELRGIANALHAALKAGLVQAGDEVVVRCDNRSTGIWIERRVRRAGRRPELAEASRVVRDLAHKAGVTIRYRWVAGHQPADSRDPEAIHNRRADALCGVILGTKGKRPRLTPEEQSARDKARSKAAKDRQRLEKTARRLSIALAGELRT